MTNTNVTLFITDDDADDRDFLIDALLHQGYDGTIEKLANGEELLKRLKKADKHNNNLIILDLNMPVLNGYDTLKAIRTDTALKNLPVIILSATSKSEDKAYCLNLGCNSFLHKPLSYTGYQQIADTILSSILICR